MPIVYSTPFPRIFTRPIECEMDWWRVRNLLIETHALCGPEFNWEIRHWDGNRFHREGPLWNPALYEKFCLWETEHGQLVGVAHAEGDEELCLQIHPDCRAAIEEEIIAWGEEHVVHTNTAGKRQLCLCVYEYDAPRRRLLEKRGYEKTSDGWITRILHLANQPLPEPVLAEGYTLRATYPKDHSEVWNDCVRMADVLNAGFNRNNVHSAADSLNFFTHSPSFRNDLNLVAVAPDGSFAAHVGLTLDVTNRYAIFEPVCTHPAHRRKGLAQTLMFEGLQRIQRLGANHVEVSTGDADAANALYDSIGFSEAYKAQYWKKVF
jgi:mycothiol synthase